MERKGTTFSVGRLLLDTAGGITGIGSIVLLGCGPADDGPMTWGFAAVKLAGFAMMLLTGWLYGLSVRRYGGDGDDE